MNNVYMIFLLFLVCCIFIISIAGIITCTKRLFKINMMIKMNKEKLNKTLFNACKEGKPEVVKYLVEHLKGVNNAKDENGLTACFICSLDIVEYLIEYGTDINAKNKYGDTALMYACVNGNLDVVKYLVNKGADINAKNEGNYTALMFACSNGRIEIVKYLVEKLADVNARSWCGKTALMLAKEHDCLEVAEYLVKGGEIK